MEGITSGPPINLGNLITNLPGVDSRTFLRNRTGVHWFDVFTYRHKMILDTIGYFLSLRRMSTWWRRNKHFRFVFMLSQPLLICTIHLGLDFFMYFRHFFYCSKVHLMNMPIIMNRAFYHCSK